MFYQFLFTSRCRFLWWSETEFVWCAGHYLAYRTSSRVIDGDECVSVGGMSGKRNRSTRRKPAPVPPCSPQVQHDLNWAPTCTASVETLQLLAELRHGLIAKLRSQYRTFLIFCFHVITHHSNCRILSDW
jgi:hypothetical protein